MVINSQNAAQGKWEVKRNLNSALKKKLLKHKDYKTDFSFKFELIYANNNVATRIWFFPAKNTMSSKSQIRLKRSKIFTI